MKTLYYLFLEYFLMLKLHVQSLYKSVPKDWEKGEKGDVIIVPGFFETWYFLSYIANRLNAEGYRIHVITDLQYNTMPIKMCAKILSEFIEKNKLSNALIISHSKGGLVSKLYLDSFNDRNHKIINLTTPYMGTIWGKLHFFNICEFIPNCEALKQILNNKDNLGKVINIYAKFDNHIYPHSNATLEGAENREIDIVGHTRILNDRRTWEVIKESI